MRSTIIALGIVAWMILGAGAAYAQEESDDPRSSQDDLDPRGEVDINRSRVLIGDDDKEFDRFIGYSDVSVGMGGGTTLSPGKEISLRYMYGTLEMGARHVGWTALDRLHVQVGGRLAAGFSGSNSREWLGQSDRIGGGAEFAFFPIPDAGKKAFWSANIRTMFTFEREFGHSRLSDYRLHHQDTLTFNLSGWIELYPFIPDKIWKKDWRGEKFQTGFFPAIQLRTEFDIPLDVDRSTTALNRGFRDPDVNKTRIAETAVVYIRREGTLLGSLDWGVVLGVEGHRAAGYRSVDLNHSVTELNAGGCIRLQAGPRGFVYASMGVLYGVETHRTNGYISISVQLLGIVEDISDAFRSKSR